MVIASVLAHGCAHGFAIGADGADQVQCGLDELCGGGGGDGVADEVVAVAVVGVVVGAVAVAVYRRLVHGAAR